MLGYACGATCMGDPLEDPVVSKFAFSFAYAVAMPCHLRVSGASPPPQRRAPRLPAAQGARSSAATTRSRGPRRRRRRPPRRQSPPRGGRRGSSSSGARCGAARPRNASGEGGGAELPPDRAQIGARLAQHAISGAFAGSAPQLARAWPPKRRRGSRPKMGAQRQNRPRHRFWRPSAQCGETASAATNTKPRMRSSGTVAKPQLGRSAHALPPVVEKIGP